MTGDGENVDGLIDIGISVAVRILEAGQFSPLGANQVSVDISQAENLVKPAGKSTEAWILSNLHVGVLNDVHITPPRTNGHITVGQGTYATGLDQNVFRNRDGNDVVVVRLRRWNVVLGVNKAGVGRK